MEFSGKLYEAIIPDPDQHPEKLNASLERVQEVVDIVMKDEAPVMQTELAAAGLSRMDSRQSLTEQMAAIIVDNLCDKASKNQLEQIIRMLEEAEISAAEAIELHENYKIQVSHLEKDIIPVWGDGAWIRAIDGNSYLDMDSNYSATNLGFNNKEIAIGLLNQASQLISMKEDRVHVPRARFLKHIHQMMPKGLNYFYWQNSGGEAVDKSLKMAKAYTRNKGVVSFEGAFHGRTHGAVAMTYNPQYRKPFFLDNEDWVHFVSYNDADAVEKLFADGKARTVILELVQGEEAGNRPANPGFPQKLRDICNKYDGVMIVDEIQAGFGRTALKEGQWFSCMTYDVIPDIITIGKSFGGGYPVTAVVTNKKIADAMVPGYDGSTFGGNPMAMVAALIATRQMREKNLTKNVIERSKQFKAGLNALKEKYPFIGEIRVTGLMIAFELPSAKKAVQFEDELRKNGVKASLSSGKFVRYLPPLVITENDMKFLLEAMDKSFDAIAE